LTRVLDEAVGRLRPGGAVFVGDLRPIEAAGAQHASVALLHAPETARAGDVRRQIDARLARDGELLISPAFFDAFVAQRPDLKVVSCNLKRGRAANELVKFRYDVVLRRLGSPQQEEDKKPPQITPQRISAPTGDALQWLRGALNGNPAALVVAGLPNARVAGDLFVLDECRAANTDLGVPELRAESSARARAALDPEDVFSLSTDYEIEVRPRPGHAGLFDASFARKDIGGLAAVVRDARPSSSPDTELVRRFAVPDAKARPKLDGELRAHLREKLPDFMVPSAVVILERLPMTPNGKIDRNALPAPQTKSPRSAASGTRPVNDLETAIAAVFEQLLGHSPIGTGDNFFDIGANSLLIVQANSKLRAALGRKLSLVDMFQYPTVKSLAAFMGHGEVAGGDAPPGNPTSPTLRESQERGQARRDALQRRRVRRTGNT
jgi:hypothetical protein